MEPFEELRPRGKVAVLCSTPDCGFELYADPLDERLLGEGIKCSFCLGEQRMACCPADPQESRKILDGSEPCPGCDSTVDRFDHITETVMRAQFPA